MTQQAGEPNERTFTVVGLVDNTCAPCELTVAGVLAGEHRMVDEHGGPEYAQRWADVFEADSADEAERLAHEAVADLTGEGTWREIERRTATGGEDDGLCFECEQAFNAGEPLVVADFDDDAPTAHFHVRCWDVGEPTPAQQEGDGDG